MTNSIFYNIKNKYYQNIRKNNIQLVTIKSKLTQRNTNHQTLSATYNMFRDPISITENTTVNFDYNYNNQRSRVTYANSAKTKYYSEGMQVEVIKNNNDYKFITYIDGDPYSANIIYVKTQSSSGYYYLHRDNQGTILGISDSSGIMIEQRIFDPWGNLKQGSISFIERGYTGHEHFLEISLIHMNARLYDPVKKIFLTPDNVLQDPYNPQNYNKFGYCLNNPLKYTDPSGNEPITITVGAYFIAAGISALISSIFYVAQNAYNQQGFDWGGLGLSILQGAVSGAAAYGIGSAFTTASVVAALGKTGTIFAQAAAHGLSQATISGIFRGDFSNFGSDFAAGAVSSLVGSGISKLQIDNPALRKLSMYVGGAISGGLAASVTGGDFLDGAATGLIVTALNHAGHEVGDQIVSSIQQHNLEKLLMDIIKEIGLDLDITKNNIVLTTVAPHGWELNDDGLFTNKADGSIVGGITTTNWKNNETTIAISPGLIADNGLTVRGTIIHEFKHASNNKLWGKTKFKSLEPAQREVSAYIAGAEYYFSKGSPPHAFATMKTFFDNYGKGSQNNVGINMALSEGFGYVLSKSGILFYR